MNFDSLEGLSDEEISSLYMDEEKLADWYGTFCKTFYADSSSSCVSAVGAYATSNHCSLECTGALTFTERAMNAKCNALCGGGGDSDLSLKSNTHIIYANDYNFTARNIYCYNVGHNTGNSYQATCFHWNYLTCHANYFKSHMWYYYGGGGHWGSWQGNPASGWVSSHVPCQVLLDR